MTKAQIVLTLLCLLLLYGVVGRLEYAQEVRLSENRPVSTMRLTCRHADAQLAQEPLYGDRHRRLVLLTLAERATDRPSLGRMRLDCVVLDG